MKIQSINKNYVGNKANKSYVFVGNCAFFIFGTCFINFLNFSSWKYIFFVRGLNIENNFFSVDRKNPRSKTTVTVQCT